ncbi:MAG: SCO family protein [Wenzhouxiangellaceae bacterium]|nr:SCO family protein [Wenzhouxiangellaceae bacterium]
MNRFFERYSNLVVVVLIITGIGFSAKTIASGPDRQAEQNFLVSQKNYTAVDVDLVTAAGESVNFNQLVSSREVTVISFIFTSCAGICPMITSNMVRAVPELDKTGDDYQILLVSVDPDFDTPERLSEYAQRFNTGNTIDFLTGPREDVVEVLRSLDALYEGSNKMNHQPVTLIRNSDAGPWARIDGLIGSEVLLEQYQRFVGVDALE